MKLLLLDIETAPNIVHVWGLWKQNVAINQIIASGYVMCWAAKWYQEEQIVFDSVQRTDSKRMLSRIHKLINEADAWRRMEEYNRNDVLLLEAVYDRMRPWIRAHPNHGLYDEPGLPVCPNCGGGHLLRRGYARTVVQKYARYQCKDCGTWSREAITELPKEDRQMILRRDLG